MSLRVCWSTSPGAASLSDASSPASAPFPGCPLLLVVAVSVVAEVPVGSYASVVPSAAQAPSVAATMSAAAPAESVRAARLRFGRDDVVMVVPSGPGGGDAVRKPMTSGPPGTDNTPRGIRWVSLLGISGG